MANIVHDVDGDSAFDFVIVGSGFGSLFFLKKMLETLPQRRRILIIERGAHLSHAEQRALDANAVDPADRARPTGPSDFIRVPQGHKSWNFTMGVGGGTVCWWGTTLRMHPADFSLRSQYGVGADWPVTYDDLEPYYCDAEDIMGVSGDSNHVGPYTRSRPYPMPAFLPSDADAAMRAAHAEQLPLAAARTSVTTGPRTLCCAFGDCRLCPNDAKFTALNGMNEVLDDPRVSILVGANALALETAAGVAQSVVYVLGGATRRCYGDHFVLGANAIFNPAILHRSALHHPELGAGITEQIGANVEVKLAALSGVNGGTSGTGFYTGLIDGDHRRTRGATMFLFDNRWKWQGLRTEVGKHLNTLLIIANTEDLRSRDHFVEVPADWSEPPVVHHAGHTEYGVRGLELALESLPGLLDPLGVEDISRPQMRPTESHLQCTTPCGDDPGTSIVDRDLIHHQVRNISVVGTSVFPTCPVAHPSLTAAALSLRAADRLAH